jgi:hypothetical protein
MVSLMAPGYVTGIVSGRQVIPDTVATVMVPKVALVEPYWDFWEASVPYDLRADRAAIGAAVRAALDARFTWVDAAEQADDDAGVAVL